MGIQHSPTSGSPGGLQQSPFAPVVMVEMRGGGEVAVLPLTDVTAGGIDLGLGSDELLGLKLDESVILFLNVDGDGGPLYSEVSARVAQIERGDESRISLRWSDDPAPDSTLTKIVARLVRRAEQSRSIGP